LGSKTEKKATAPRQLRPQGYCAAGSAKEGRRSSDQYNWRHRVAGKEREGSGAGDDSRNRMHKLKLEGNTFAGRLALHAAHRTVEKGRLEKSDGVGKEEPAIDQRNHFRSNETTTIKKKGGKQEKQSFPGMARAKVEERGKKKDFGGARSAHTHIQTAPVIEPSKKTQQSGKEGAKTSDLQDSGGIRGK